jgi:hypothetical protein
MQDGERGWLEVRGIGLCLPANREPGVARQADGQLSRQLSKKRIAEITEQEREHRGPFSPRTSLWSLNFSVIFVIRLQVFRGSRFEGKTTTEILTLRVRMTTEKFDEFGAAYRGLKSRLLLPTEKPHGRRGDAALNMGYPDLML